MVCSMLEQFPLVTQWENGQSSEDIKQYYHDPKVLAMLENIITNPIDTPRGYKNPSRGIALRGPLSQFFSALYLKPLDDALSSMDII